MRFAFLPLFVFLSFGLGHTQAQSPKWKLIWQEEFNYTGLPDSSKWSYEVGHIRNNEKQYYTEARKENIWVENGMLTITGRKERIRNAFYVPGSTDWKTKDSLAEYTSASIKTIGKADWKYGKIEVRAKLPHGGGIWPAIWMKGSNNAEVPWPKCGEIDIMEHVGNHPSDIYGTLHYLKPGTEQLITKTGVTQAPNLRNEWHVYSIEWDKDKIEVFFDGKKYNTLMLDEAGTKQQDNPFRKPFYMLLNLAMGAAWPGPIDEAVLPQQFFVDYVRVYQKAEN